MVLKVFKILTILIMGMGAIVVSAQAIPTPPGIQVPTLSDYLEMEISPEYPGPNQEVSVNLRLSQSDLNRAEISWFLNDEIQKSGVGEKTFTFTTGSIGTTSRISVSIDTFEGENASRELVVRPGALDLIWNAETYSPPFYRGKALATQRSRIRVTAIPQLVGSEGNVLNPKSLIYNWKEGNKVLGSQSGIGKDVVILEGKLITRPRNINVTIESLDGSFKSFGSVVVNNRDHSVLVYQDHPLYGIMFNRVLDSFILEDQEVSLAAFPYFFNTPSRDDEKIEYSWTQGSRSVGLASQSSTITFGLPSGSELNDDIRIGVSVTNKENSTQRESRNITLKLNER